MLKRHGWQKRVSKNYEEKSSNGKIPVEQSTELQIPVEKSSYHKMSIANDENV